MRHGKLTFVVLAGAGLLGAAMAAQAAPELFTYSPAAPLTNELVTFTAATDGTITWDLDGDGACDDATGPTATRSFSTAGGYTVRMCVNGDELVNRQTVTIQNRPPVASFAHAPVAPVVGETVTMTSTATDPDGPIVAHSWDLDADSVFDDAAGGSASRVYSRPGVHPVALQVTDRDGATSLAFAWIKVSRRPLTVMSPSPVVRVDGTARATGVIVRVFKITAPRGVRVGIRCRGGGCPYARRPFKSRGSPIRVRSLERPLRAGAIVEVFLRKPGHIGKYTRLRVRVGRAPARVDRCLRPGVRRAVSCPSL